MYFTVKKNAEEKPFWETPPETKWIQSVTIGFMNMSTHKLKQNYFYWTKYYISRVLFIELYVSQGIEFVAHLLEIAILTR